MESERLVRRITNSFRPGEIGEPAGDRRSPKSGYKIGWFQALSLRVKATWEIRRVVGDGMVGRFCAVNRGDLKPHRERRLTALSWAKEHRSPRASGVRAPIVASKSGNSDGAKGRRKVDVR
jgi:hypothetical protein